MNWKKGLFMTRLAFEHFPSDIFVPWYLLKDPTSFGSPFPAKTKGWMMWSTTRHCMEILWSDKLISQHMQELVPLHSSHLEFVCQVLAISVDCLRSLRSAEHFLSTSDFSLGVIWIKISDPISFKSWSVNETVESTLVTDLSAPHLTHHDPSDLDHWSWSI